MTMAEGNAIPSEAVGGQGIGKSMLDLFASSTEIIAALNGVLRGESVNTTAELSGRWFDIWGQPVRDRDGKVSGGIAVSTDITERVLSEQKLKQEQEQFRVLVENATDLIVMLSREGTLLFASPSVEEQTGYTVEEVAGRDAFELVHPEDRSLVMESAQRCVCQPQCNLQRSFSNLLQERRMAAVRSSREGITGTTKPHDH